MSKKVVLITGGGSGIGQLAAWRFAEQGMYVAVLDINEAGLIDTCAKHASIVPFVVDMTDCQAIKDIVAQIEHALGDIDVVYNCAAIMPFGKLTEHNPEQQKLIMNINVGGLINITHAVVPLMVKRGSGLFVSFASMAGILPTLLTGAYSASKAAVIFYTETLWQENIESGVQFVCVCPPTVATPLLKQAQAAWPKMLDESSGGYLTPENVLDAIDHGVKKNQFHIFPNKDAKRGYWFRRLIPNLIWKHIHKVEGW